jgi:hypothetical protein
MIIFFFFSLSCFRIMTSKPREDPLPQRMRAQLSSEAEASLAICWKISLPPKLI